MTGFKGQWTLFRARGQCYHVRSEMREGRQRTVYRHREVMEAHLGRRLDRTELVHHIDGNGLNNDLDNLEVVTALIHKALHTFTGAEYRLVCAAAAVSGMKPGAFVFDAAVRAALTSRAAA